MAVEQNNKLAKWLAEAIAERGGLTLRQVEVRTGVSYSTVNNVLNGRVPDAATLILLGDGLGQDSQSIASVLRIAGHDRMAEVWEKHTSGTPIVMEDRNRHGLDEYQEDEILSSYAGVPADLRPRVLRALKAFMNTPNPHDPGGHTYGKKAE